MIVVRFAYYYPPLDEIPAVASYLVEESDVPGLSAGMNVGGEQLLMAHVGIPLTPTHSTWLKMGRPIYRGKRFAQALRDAESEPYENLEVASDILGRLLKS